MQPLRDNNVDEKIKIVAGELIKKREKSDKDAPAETPTVKISGGIKDSAIIIGTGNTISGIYNKSPIDKKEIHQTHVGHQSFAEKESDIQAIIDKDPSAHLQGRKPLGWRKRGERVKPEFMTPKEYTHFVARTPDDKPMWDGIERKFMRLNWEPWDWGKKAKKESPSKTNRRYQGDRRHGHEYLGIEDKRHHGIGRREDDITSSRIYTITLTLVGLMLGVMIVLSIMSYVGVIS